MEEQRKFVGWDGFKTLNTGTKVQDQKGFIYKVIRPQGRKKMVYLEMIHSPDAHHRITERELKVPIYWSLWTVVERT